MRQSVNHDAACVYRVRYAASEQCCHRSSMLGLAFDPATLALSVLWLALLLHVSSALAGSYFDGVATLRTADQLWFMDALQMPGPCNT